MIMEHAYHKALESGPYRFYLRSLLVREDFKGFLKFLEGLSHRYLP